MYYYIVSTKEMVKITYQDELMYLEQEKQSKYLMLQEESESYEIVNTKNINNEHDKIYKQLLSSNKNVADIINKALKLNNKKKVKPEELEKYSSSFITNELKNREADIVYKLKEKNIFFLIEHQSKPDYSMPYRIGEYKLEIIKSAIDIKKAKTKGYEMPEVIPIVIYTGKRDWKVRLYLNQIQEERFKKVDLLKYHLVDIHKYANDKLLETNNFMDKIFLIEKTKDTKELVETLEKVISKTTKEEDKKNLKVIITTTLKEKLGENKAKELVKKMEGVYEDMLAVVEMVREENKRLRREGRKEGKKEGRKEGRREVITTMLRNGMKVEQIEGITGLTSREIKEAEKIWKAEELKK